MPRSGNNVNADRGPRARRDLDDARKRKLRGAKPRDVWNVGRASSLATTADRAGQVALPGSQSRPRGSSTAANGSSAADSSPSVSVMMVHAPFTR
jgi:hypothetical protein